eukprot:3092747-Prymnesium_polylepis.1
MDDATWAWASHDDATRRSSTEACDRARLVVTCSWERAAPLHKCTPNDSCQSVCTQVSAKLGPRRHWLDCVGLLLPALT